MPSDILTSWKMFIDELQKKHGHKKATLVMHTDPMDQEGTNLFQVMEVLDIKDNVVFSKDRIGFGDMKMLYNACDTIVNRSCNEGFGLPTLEMAMCGKPIIVIKTGGLTRQVEDPVTKEQFGIGFDPEVRTMVGNHMVPFIYEDFISHETLRDGFMKMYEMGPDAREELGKKAMERARQEYSLDKMISDWDASLEKVTTEWKEARKPRWKVTEL
jgi:glycosyltransferase involved in cell wall biosynthesis